MLHKIGSSASTEYRRNRAWLSLSSELFMELDPLCSTNHRIAFVFNCVLFTSLKNLIRCLSLLLSVAIALCSPETLFCSIVWWLLISLSPFSTQQRVPSRAGTMSQSHLYTQYSAQSPMLLSLLIYLTIKLWFILSLNSEFTFINVFSAGR